MDDNQSNQEKDTIRGGCKHPLIPSWGGVGQFRYGASTMQGYRPNQEDALICETRDLEGLDNNHNHGHGLFCVLDGHGGREAAEFGSEELCHILCQTEQWKTYVQKVSPYLSSSFAGVATAGKKNKNHTAKKSSTPNSKTMKELTNLLKDAFIKSFVELDRELYLQRYYDDLPSSSERPTETAGSTAVAVLITPLVILCANIGDSRCVLACSNTTTPNSITAYPLSEDHKPDLPDEQQRILKSGGQVWQGRVNGELAVSRALGDFEYKQIQGLLLQDYDPFDANDVEQLLELARNQKVSAYPEIRIHERNDTTDRFVVLACDGVWDVMSNEDCIEFVLARFQKGETDLGDICDDLLDKCILQLGSQDNMTIIIILLEGGQKLISGKSTIRSGKGGGTAVSKKRR